MIEEKITGYGKLKRWVSQRIRLRSDSIFVGPEAGHSNTTGVYNTFLGRQAGYSNTNSVMGVYIGNGAGYHETANNKLFIDNQNRTDEADGRIKALIYGVFDPATANQLLRINGILELPEIKSGTSQANAGATINELWKTHNATNGLPDNVIMIGV